LLWQATSGVDGPVTIHHPILLKRVELRFDPRVPEFTIHETDREPEIYGSLFVDLQDVAPTAIARAKSELEAAGCHPLRLARHRRLPASLHPDGFPARWANSSTAPPRDGASTTPRLYREPVLVLRKRSPASPMPSTPSSTTSKAGKSSRPLWRRSPAQWTNGKRRPRQPANGGNGLAARVQRRRHPARQRSQRRATQIIRRLEHSGAVLVQGPPGTGKTHTIGNLIGHLLAQGKSILVTAQTAKALRVVRDKVPEILRPLAVSVLGSDQDARRHLESAISSITERLTGDSAEGLLDKARQWRAQRQELLSRQGNGDQQTAPGARKRVSRDRRRRSAFHAFRGRRFVASTAKRTAGFRSRSDWVPT
jgi:hypothetical protein